VLDQTWILTDVKRLVRWPASGQIPEAALPVRDLPLGAAGQALPEHPIIHGDEGVDGALVSLAALETQRTCRLVRAIEVGGVGNHGSDEVCELAGRAPLRGYGAPGVEVMSKVDDVQGHAGQ